MSISLDNDDSPCNTSEWLRDWTALIQDPMNEFNQSDLATLIAVGLERLHKDQARERQRKS